MGMHCRVGIHRRICDHCAAAMAAAAPSSSSKQALAQLDAVLKTEPKQSGGSRA